MTETEITLFKELIRETVRSVLKEEKFKMTEEVKKAFAKDLKDIKILIAGQIKENRERPVAQMVEISTRADRVTAGPAGTALSETRANALKNALASTARGMGVPIAQPATPKSALKTIQESKMDPTLKSILAQTAATMTEEDQESFLPGEAIAEEPQLSDQVYYSSEEVEEAYVPKYASGGLPDFPL